MTADELTSMRFDLRIAVSQLEYARGAIDTDPAQAGASTRNISIAITRLEEALIWTHMAMFERNLSTVEDSDVGFENSHGPEHTIKEAIKALQAYRKPLRVEHTSGPAAKWYRQAILNTINNLESAIGRCRIQLSEIK